MRAFRWSGLDSFAPPRHHRVSFPNTIGPPCPVPGSAGHRRLNPLLNGRACTSSTLLAVLLLIATRCAAHEDRVLKLEADGSLTGLPREYGPVSLRVVFSSKGSERHIVESGITIRGHSSTLPPCVLSTIRSDGMDDIRVSASWYHDERDLPYYVDVTFLDATLYRDDGAGVGSSVSVLYDLRTAQPMRIEREVVSWVFGSHSRRPVPLDGCSAEELLELRLEPRGT